MNIFEVFTVPEIRTDVAGEYRYVCIGAWSSLTAKNRGDGITAIVDGVERKAELFNDFKVYYASTGTRIVTRIRNDQEEYQRTDGRWIRWDRVTIIDETLGWRRETFIRDTSAEIQECIDRYLARANNLGYRGDMRGTTLNLQVAASLDDARELDDGTSFNATDASQANASNTLAAGRGNIGARFTGVTIAAGSTINSAVWSPYVASTVADSPNVDIYFNDVDSAANFSDEADVTSRTNTTASVQWTATDVGTGFGTGSPSIATPLQEVIDRAGWASGNAVVVLSRGKSDATSGFTLNTYDHSSARASKLDIDYTAPAAGWGMLLPQTRNQLVMPA